MGWNVMSDPWYNKARLVRLLVDPAEWKGGEVTPVRHSVVGNHLWILLDRVSGEGSPQEIGLYLLQGRQPGDEPGGWGYKDLPVREHLDCPAYMLDADLCPGYYGDWILQVKQERAEARQLERRLAALQPGEVLSLHGRRFRLGVRLRDGFVVQEVTAKGPGSTYSMTLAQARQSLREMPPEPATSSREERSPAHQEALL